MAPSWSTHWLRPIKTSFPKCSYRLSTKPRTVRVQCVQKLSLMVHLHQKNIPQLIGFFDENIGVGAPTPWQSGEETDYLLRILTAGRPVVLCTNAHIFHDAEANHPLNLDKTKSYSAGRMYTIKKHNLPTWFAICNVLYPLLQIISEVPRDGLPALKRRITMFCSRLYWLVKLAMK